MEESEGPRAAAAPALRPDEKTWAALAHATVLLALLSGGPLGPIAAFIIWLIKQHESPYVGRQAMQSLVFQLVAMVLMWIMWVVIVLLMAVCVGFCLIPIGLLATLAPVIYGCYAAYECSLGHDFGYVWIGDLIR